jgi:antitoxin (DNA-binding transcriptional repressor) of toxin-antitoxin stability system
MKTATIAELHENLDEYLELVRGGEAVEITDEKGQVAQLVPAVMAKAAADFNARIEAAIAAGTLRRGTGKLPADFLTRELPTFSSSVLEALLEEREEGW